VRITDSRDLKALREGINAYCARDSKDDIPESAIERAHAILVSLPWRDDKDPAKPGSWTLDRLVPNAYVEPIPAMMYGRDPQDFRSAMDLVKRFGRLSPGACFEPTTTVREHPGTYPGMLLSPMMSPPPTPDSVLAGTIQQISPTASVEVPIPPWAAATAEPENASSVDETLSWGHKALIYTEQYGMVAGVALLGITLGIVIIKKLRKKR
jgi:hypothetical protein